MIVDGLIRTFASVWLDRGGFPAATTPVQAAPAMSSLDTAGALVRVDPMPAPLSGGAACAALVGGAVALSSYFGATNAHDATARLARLTSPMLPLDIRRALSDTRGIPFDPAIDDLHPYWIATIATILEHATIAGAHPRPSTIGGYPLADVLDGARRLAASAPPFDRIVPCLDRIVREEGYDHAR